MSVNQWLCRERLKGIWKDQTQTSESEWRNKYNHERNKLSKKMRDKISKFIELAQLASLFSICHVDCQFLIQFIFKFFFFKLFLCYFSAVSAEKKELLDTVKKNILLFLRAKPVNCWDATATECERRGKTPNWDPQWVAQKLKRRQCQVISVTDWKLKAWKCDQLLRFSSEPPPRLVASGQLPHKILPPPPHPHSRFLLSSLPPFLPLARPLPSISLFRSSRQHARSPSAAASSPSAHSLTIPAHFQFRAAASFPFNALIDSQLVTSQLPVPELRVYFSHAVYF